MVLVVAGVSACSNDPSAPTTHTSTQTSDLALTPTAESKEVSPVPVDEISSGLQRASVTEVSSEDLSTLVHGNNAFALDLYQALRNQGGNLFFSPYSISTALAMVYAGTGSETERQMAKVMHYTSPQESLHLTLNYLDREITSRHERNSTKELGGFKLHVANSVWGEKTCSFSPTYLDTLATNYGAGLRSINFSGAPESSRETINKWVEDQTEEKIKDIFPERSIDESTLLVLANAIYFKANWRFPFEEEDTRDQAFFLVDGQEVQVPTMFQEKSFEYTEGDGYKALLMLYAGYEVSMLVLLPDRDRFAEFELGLDSRFIEGLIEDLRRSFARVYFPKFGFESGFDLKQTLELMGMTDAFSPSAADLSGMGIDCPGRSGRPYISSAYHKSFVRVYEEGTEAAAATVAGTHMSRPPPALFNVNRPFIFLIRDNSTGSILFVGRVMDPSQSTE